MSLINVTLNLVAYADAMKTVNPSVKFTDLKWSLLGLPTGNPQMVPINLAPGQTQTIMNLTRVISFSGSTSFSIVQVAGTSDAQLVAGIGQRIARADGDGTTQWIITNTNGLVQFQYSGTGTAPTFSGMAVGDGITIGSGFNTFNQGDFVIVNLGSNYVEFENPLGVPETVTGQIEIYSSGPVQIGDVLEINSAEFSFPNQGQFKITRVTDSFIQFCNQSAVPETVTGITTGVFVYPESQHWLLAAVDREVILQFNGDTGQGFIVQPPVDNDLVNNPGLCLKRGKMFQLTIINPGLCQATGFVFLSE